jgi:hypothetical protein
MQESHVGNEDNRERNKMFMLHVKSLLDCASKALTGGDGIGWEERLIQFKTKSCVIYEI